MNLWKRALLYVRRKRGKTILLLLILTVMSSLALIALAVARGAMSAADDLQKSLGGSFEVQPTVIEDDPKLWKITQHEDGRVTKAYTGPAVNDELVKEIIKVKGIKTYSTSSWICLYMSDAKLIPGLIQSNIDEGIPSPVPSHPNEVEVRSPSFYGTNNSEYHQHFRTGGIKLIEGRHIQPGDVSKAIISEELAALNHLSVGDTFTAECRDELQARGFNSTSGKPFHLEVVGVYKIFANTEASKYSTEFLIPGNTIYCDESTVMQAYRNWSFKEQYSFVYFYVDDPAHLKDVIKEVKALDTINWMYFHVSVDDSAYKTSAAPLRTMTTLSIVLIVLVLAGCVALLLLILTMEVRNRKREMGIYLSMGIGKVKIVGQMFVELTMISVAAYLLSTVIAVSAANPVGNAVLQATTPEQMEAKYRSESSFIFYEAAGKAPERIDIKVNAGDIEWMIAGGTAIIGGATFFSGSSILKRRPKDILASGE
ncbi:ABC transporter permease [Zongyangia hominis]|uniref:ABC transporter permease n=1 Tax=Zongyangia hominis TaxID=2763677 RepID=A0A926ECU1_9FIRM|nr:ABC transporter permease [Zongyangia hominis]MBC8569874.1 ABC transporter permease [Zongyangia hominis]